jgi:SAM-dependent methyltransferase
MMAEVKQYVIRGGVEGRERLRVLARVMHASSAALLDRIGLSDGQSCLDVGCGGGDMTRELARRVAPHGKAMGADIDRTKLELARHEAEQQGVANVGFQLTDACELPGARQFDVVYARFLLTHLSDPDAAVTAFHRLLRPGGLVAVEDVDFSGYFTYPECPAFRRYHALYCDAVRRRGANPNIGPRLPLLLKECGFEDVGVSVVQPIGTQGEVKLINALTMENIAEAVLQDGLATRGEIDELVRQLNEFAEDHNTLAGMPRVVQTWGRRPAA